MSRIIKAMSSVGLYCQRCGRLHIYDVPYFSGSTVLNMKCQRCGNNVAKISYEECTSVRLSLKCSICDHEHVSVYQKRLLPKVKLNRIYCRQDNFELGYVGKRSNIEALLKSSQAAFEALHPEAGHDAVDCQRQLLEGINIIHDIAPSGYLSCRCGESDFAVDIKGSRILLECRYCGRIAVVNTANSEELAWLEEYRQLDFRHMASWNQEQTRRFED